MRRPRMSTNPEYAEDEVEDAESLVQPLNPTPSDDDRVVGEAPPAAPFDEDREVVDEEVEDD
jgi:hypothetical protein